MIRIIVAFLLLVTPAWSQINQGGYSAPPGTGGDGTGCVPSGGAATNVVLYGTAGACSPAPDANVVLGALTLGASGTLGSVTMGNATTGTVTIRPVTGALGTVTASLPANTGTIAELNLAQTWTAAQTINPSGSPAGTGLVVDNGATIDTLLLTGNQSNTLINLGSPTTPWYNQPQIEFNGTTGQEGGIFFNASGNSEWGIEGSADGVNGDLVIDRFTTGGTYVDSPIAITLATGRVTLADGATTGASTTSVAPFTIPQGVAPTSPANGNIWTTSAGMYVRIAGATVGPLGTGGSGITALTGDVTASGTGSVAATVVHAPVSGLTGAGSNVTTALGVALSAPGGMTSTIASGTSALGTGAISSASCATVVTTTATNTATTDVVSWGFNGDPTGVTGYTPVTTGALTIFAYPSANNVNFKVCNLTSASITPGAITLNWRIAR